MSVSLVDLLNASIAALDKIGEAIPGEDLAEVAATAVTAIRSVVQAIQGAPASVTQVDVDASLDALLKGEAENDAATARAIDDKFPPE